MDCADTKIHLHFTNKAIHLARNLDDVYHKVKSIEPDFAINILYKKSGNEAGDIRSFLVSQDINVNDIQEESIGGLLVFDGKEFIAWYEQVHECDKYQQRCNQKDLNDM